MSHEAATQPEAIIRPYEPRDHRQVSALVRRRVGYPCFRDDWCVGEGVFASVVLLGSKVIGFGLAKIASEDEIALLKQKTRSRRGVIGRARKILYIDTVAVHESTGGRGIAAMIMRSLISESGADFAYMDAWKSVLKGVHLDRAARAVGFVPDGVMGRLWAADSKKWDYFCYGCNRCPCRCTAVLYLWQPSAAAKRASSGRSLRPAAG